MWGTLPFHTKSGYKGTTTGDKQEYVKYWKYLWEFETLHNSQNEKKNANLLCLNSHTLKNRKQSVTQKYDKQNTNMWWKNSKYLDDKGKVYKWKVWREL